MESANNKVLVKVKDVEFCRNFVNKGECFGVNCVYIHSDKRTEQYYKKHGLLPTGLADFWQKSLAFRRKWSSREKSVCWDHVRSKCFRVNCTKGEHPFLRTRNDADYVKFKFFGSERFHKAYQAITMPNLKFGVDVYVNKCTPFRYVLESMNKSIYEELKPVKFAIMANGSRRYIDASDTPRSLNLGNGGVVYVLIAATTFDKIMAEPDKFMKECPICIGVRKEEVFLQCGHAFCGFCLSKWLKVKLSCPICCTTASTLYSNVRGSIATEKKIS